MAGHRRQRPIAAGPQRRASAHEVTPPSGTPASTRKRQARTSPADAARRGLRYRVLPRSLLGVTALILAFALGAGFSGVVLYSYYQYHLDQTNTRVNTLIDGYKKQFANAEGDLQASAKAAKTQIQTQLAPLQKLEANPNILGILVKTLAPSLFFVHTQDANGQAAVGTAFVISSNATQSLLLTSAATVAASQQNPGPAIVVSQGSVDTKVTVRSIDVPNDLALIVLPTGRLPVIKVAPSTPPPQIGDKIYAMSGVGGAGASVSQGAITDVSSSGLTHNAPLGAAFVGGPLVNATGEVVAIASKAYAPQGFTSNGVYFAPYPQAACTKVLACPGGTIAPRQ